MARRLALLASLLLLAWPAARWGKKAAAGDANGLSRKKSLIATAVTSVVALAAAAAMYYGAAAVIPAALAAAFGAAAIANVTFGIMAATGGAFFLLFLPDIISIMRGRAPTGFTPGFSLLFLLASLGFVVWTGHLAWIAAPGSPVCHVMRILVSLARSIPFFAACSARKSA